MWTDGRTKTECEDRARILTHNSQLQCAIIPHNQVSDALVTSVVVIVLSNLKNDKSFADMNLKLNMFAWLGLFMAHDPEFLQKDPPGKHLYVV